MQALQRLSRTWWLSEVLQKGQNNFNAIRLVAAASVVVSHAFFLATGTSNSEPLTSVSVYSLGQHAVNVFFVLSGLLVAASLDHSRSVWSFLAKRALRLFPGLVVCIAVTILLGALVTTLSARDYFSSPSTLAYVVQTLSLSTGLAQLPGVFESSPVRGLVNIPLWSLKYEALCYLVLAAIAWGRVWRSNFLFGGFVVMFLALYIWTETRHERVTEHVLFDQVLRFTVCFFLGVMAYRLRAFVPLSMPVVIALLVLLVATHQTRLEEFVSYVALGYIALSCAVLPLERFRDFTDRVDLSYGIYIYGWPVGQTVLHFTPSQSPLTVAVCSLVVATLLAMASWFLVEKPALALKRN